MTRRRVRFESTALAIAAAMALGTASAGTARDAAQPSSDLTRINPAYMITAKDALSWARFKAEGGPTYAGSPGGIRYKNFLVSTMQELGAVDLDYVDIPYDHYIVNDWPDPKTHIYGSGVEVEKLVTDGTPVPVVAGYGMTSGSTPTDGLTAQMLYYDPANPPTADQIKGKILVYQTAPYPQPAPGSNGPYAYTSSVLDSYTYTDNEFQSPGNWPEMYTPVPASTTSSYHSRWVWAQLNGFASTAIADGAAGMVVVYDLSPGAAFGLVQRSVYTPTGKAGEGAVYTNVPTLTLDRVNGAKVIADAKAGKQATLTLIAHFQTDTGQAVIGYLPGKDYGTPQDQQILLATHQDAMSLVEEDGGLGMLGILNYFNHIPQSQRPRTLIFYFDNRHFMPGGEGSWPQYDYYTIHPELLKPIIATMGMEHMGGRQTIETGSDGNTYEYSKEGIWDGRYITSLIDVNNNNQWLIEQIGKAANDNNWPRVEAKTGAVEPGILGGFQGSVKSPMNKGRSYTPQIPGLGLAGDWPGGWTQTFSQLQTEATGEGILGFESAYFIKQVAGLSQIAGNLMLVDPLVIDLGWGQIKSGLNCASASICTTAPVSGLLPDSGFLDPGSAPSTRGILLREYTTAFVHLEGGAYDKVKSDLQQLEKDINSFVAQPNATALTMLIDGQIAKLPTSTTN